MRVLHVITGLSSGGAETQLEMLASRSRHGPEVCALYNAGGAVGQRLGASGVKLHDLGMRSNRQVGKVLELARLMRRGRYDVAHLHLYRATVYGRIAARLAGTPVVVTTEHSLGDTQIEGRPKGAGVRALYLGTEPLSDRTIAVSGAVEERLVEWGVPEEKVVRVPNGLDFARYDEDPDGAALRRELGIPRPAFVAGAVGRLHANKRLDVLIEAFAGVLADPPPEQPNGGAYLLLAGDGPQREALKKRAEALGVARRVVFAGERRDVPRVLAALDLAVSLSREETFGLSVLEAVAARRRVLADACPALDALESRRGGAGVRRVERRPTVAEELKQVRSAIADAMNGSLRPASPTGEMLRAYDAAAVCGSIERLYESLLHQKGAGDGMRPRRNGQATATDPASETGSRPPLHGVGI